MITTKLSLSLLPAPAILQRIGSAAGNAGLMSMGYFILFGRLVRRQDNEFDVSAETF